MGSNRSSYVVVEMDLRLFRSLRPYIRRQDESLSTRPTTVVGGNLRNSSDKAIEDTDHGGLRLKGLYVIHYCFSFNSRSTKYYIRVHVKT